MFQSIIQSTGQFGRVIQRT